MSLTRSITIAIKFEYPLARTWCVSQQWTGRSKSSCFTMKCGLHKSRSKLSATQQK